MSFPLSGSIRAGKWTLGLGLLALIAGYQALPGTRLQLNGGGLELADLYRVLTCHLVHFTPGHLALNLAAFLVLGMLCERRTGRLYLPLMLFFAAVVGSIMAQQLPDTAGYRGLSGLISAQFTLVLLLFSDEAWSKRNVPALVILAAAGCAFAAKVGYEHFTGSAAFVDLAAAGVLPSPGAHITGGLAGLTGGMAWFAAKRPPCRSAPALSPVRGPFRSPHT